MTCFMTDEKKTVLAKVVFSWFMACMVIIYETKKKTMQNMKPESRRSILDMEVTLTNLLI